MKPPRSLTGRLVLGALVWLALMLGGGGWFLAAAFRETVEQQFEHRLDGLLRAMIAAIEVRPDGVALTRPLGEPRFDQIFSGWYWQISGIDGAPLRSRSLWDARLPAHPGSGERQTHHSIGPRGESLLLVERDLDFDGRRLHVLIAGDLDEVEEAVRRFDLLLAGGLGLLGLGLVAAVLIQVRYGLRPLRRLAADLDGIRDGTRARLAGDHPREVVPLVEAMNAVLDHDAALIERARTHVGNLAHGLKTPLSILKAEAPDPAVLVQIETMRRLIEHHLARAAAAAGPGRVVSVAVAPVVEEMRAALSRIHASRDVVIETIVSPDALFRGERQDLEEILGNLADNACKWARSSVRLSAANADRALRLTVEDDGPGLSPEQAAAAARRGARLDEMAPGWGLGLSIVADLVGLYGGALAFGASELGGLRVAVTLPR